MDILVSVSVDVINITKTSLKTKGFICLTVYLKQVKVGTQG